MFFKKITKNVLKTRPTILIFDSGVGGLTIYREIKKKIPNAHFIYAFDNEAFPYGEKNELFILNRVFKIIKYISLKHLLTIVIIACNTVSTIGLTKLRAVFHFPIVGVVPAIKPAIKFTRNGIICLLATKNTIKSKYTTELINRFVINCKIISLYSTKLVQLAEKKIYEEKLNSKEIINAIKQLIIIPEQPDTIILGCTHFPLLIKEFEKIFPKKTKFIDSSLAVANRIIWLLNNQTEIKYSNEENFAYCSSITKISEKLRFVLKNEGFNLLKQLILNN
ncbi:glutamate racemase [Candidatus Providencia siddallii]|uniref:glutamate racemase n=1 Tax=Candidatus Providencia siddallii TaxID=1715285 RepID=UPI00312C89AD